MQTKKVATHSGCFHCDEVLACTMLTRYTNEFKNCSITRTRDQKIIDEHDIVVDVGGLYDPSKHRYDHHQNSFTDTFSEEFQIRLSSAGLIYKHFGMEIVKNICDKILEQNKQYLQTEIQLNETILQEIYYRIYKGFIMSVDAIDNGIDQYPKDIKPLYYNKTSLWSRISRLQPHWTEKYIEDDIQRFNKAMDMADEELFSQVKVLLLSTIPARECVKQAINGRFNIHQSGQIIAFETPLPWKDHLEDFENEMDIKGVIKFVLFPESEEKKAWRVQGVPVNQGSFDLRIGLKKEWRGIKDMDILKNVTGIQDIVFVHNSGFIGGAKSFQSTLKMALESIENIQ
ncbi:hypothetical protein IMG5_039660 [Ichthyophthirius multifiliis]|uniref:Uncharacterized protein n=1 Tax=Ichthyophthirius multifiliis TaxID=5932 RepID=G0QLZ6_ICHMU|nr:hypothetical protein IMG5_039660 [Ichthyophthirius multifiliis]EGR33761.1 hypothetical protein IMG5_039660 [Ichthyophthirius multifiliis]|eukprot:XP_004038985.1 hypothetical protein IMG5_039660 [Ichthyophthirius multifiliis]